jgi:hypothetical protein
MKGKVGSRELADGEVGWTIREDGQHEPKLQRSPAGEADGRRLPEAPPKSKPAPARTGAPPLRARVARASVRISTFVLVASILALALAPTKLWRLSAAALAVSLVALFALSYLEHGLDS